MRVARLHIKNFRGIDQGDIHFGPNALLVGGNNAGKSTICEALDLVLGLERLYRRPVVDEHDFHCDRYFTEEGGPVEIQIEAVLIDLSEEARRRFGEHNLRRWDETNRTFADEGTEGPEAADQPGIVWALPVLFLGRYNPESDDFEGNTFFAHPIPEAPEDEPEADGFPPLGGGRSPFTWKHKRLCGFLFLRALRTGSRALSLQRGSLLDTILRLGESGRSQMWSDTLTRLRGLDPAIGEIEQLAGIQEAVRERMSRFVGLSDQDDATGFFASDLTRQNLREVVRFFVASRESGHLVPFQKLGTGTVNVLVFALLTFIAELKDKRSVIFAMEEPEIALPPHTQRRVSRFVLREMGQAIVTSHSPYVIEQFEPDEIVILERNKGTLKGSPVNTDQIKPKTFKTQRRQFAEAILSRAVLVVEGSTEAAVFPAAAAILEQSLGNENYAHPDLSGVSIFHVSGAGDIPRYGPAFAALGKPAFAFYDRPATAWTEEEQASLERFETSWESPFTGVEELLVKELPTRVLRSFLADAATRPDYPQVKKFQEDMRDGEVRTLCFEALKARKGEAHGYAAHLIEHCPDAESLPVSIRRVLEAIHSALEPAGQQGVEELTPEPVPTGEPQ